MHKRVSILLAFAVLAAVLLGAAQFGACGPELSAVADPTASAAETDEPIEIHSGTQQPGDADEAQPAIAFVNALDEGPLNTVAELCLTPAGAQDWGEPAAKGVPAFIGSSVCRRTRRQYQTAAEAKSMQTSMQTMLALRLPASR